MCLRLFCPETVLFLRLYISFPAISAQSTVPFWWGVLWGLQESLIRNSCGGKTCWEATDKSHRGLLGGKPPAWCSCLGCFADAGERCVQLHPPRLGIWQKFLKFNFFFSQLLNFLLFITFCTNCFYQPVNPCPKVVPRSWEGLIFVAEVPGTAPHKELCSHTRNF